MSNNSKHSISFVLFDTVYTYIIHYPQSHFHCFLNDLILFGMNIEREQIEVIKNVNLYVIDFFESRYYTVELL